MSRPQEGSEGGAALPPTDQVGPAAFEMDTLQQGTDLRDVLTSLFGEDAADVVGPMTIGRYDVQRRIGSGGMGSVYEAIDPKLDRRVAIKLLHADAPSEDRLVAEGKAMAMLNHPNVVTVHDVDAVGGHVFVAMEFVQGVTLRRWQDQRERSWRELVAMYRAFGEGIAAAHASGLVHCDLKPENILVGDDGRPRVTDFGIAKLQDSGDPASDDGPDPRSADVSRVTLTQTGTIMGTPHYMAPEQFVGRELDARADQFGFCAMLWEALFRERPYTGKTFFELAENVSKGNLRVPQGGARVPVWLRKAVERGLQPEPTARWADLRTLLDELAKGRARARRKLLGGGAVLLVAAGGGALAVGQAQRSAAITGCAEVGAALSSAWNEAQAERVREALLSTGLNYAAFTAQRVGPLLDARADAWAEAANAACTAHDVDESWDDGTYARATWCLDDHRMKFEEAIEELATASDETVAHALNVAGHPADVAGCLDTRRLESTRVPSPASRAAIVEVRRQLARAHAHRAAGRNADAKALLTDAVAQARELDWPPLTSAALEANATALLRVGQYDDAYASAQEAFFVATRDAVPDAALGAALSLMFVEGELRARPEAALLWSKHAEVVLDELDLREHRAGVTFLSYLGHIHRHTGDYATARAKYTEARELLERLRGAAHPEVTEQWSYLGTLAREAGEFEEAIAISRRVLERAVDRLGPDHPETAKHYMELASALAVAGQASEALPLAETALRIRSAAEGELSPRVAGDLVTLGGIQETLGDARSARASNERSLEILEATVGPTHPRVAAALNNLANALKRDGDFAGAKPVLQRALKIFEANDTPSYTISVVLYNLAEIHMKFRELDEARELFERSLALREAELGPHHPRVAVPLMGLVELLIDEGLDAGALPLAERALSITEREGGNPFHYGRAAGQVAKLRWELDDDRARALGVAREVKDALAMRGEDGKAAAAGLEAWLAAHPTQ